MATLPLLEAFLDDMPHAYQVLLTVKSGWIAAAVSLTHVRATKPSEKVTIAPPI